ncbi:hypothetical protein JOE58_001906 [Curtobacterium luteum]|uniref:Uncharacterized protein n=1 Tax=Curtobacterium luteum TaxID=33881 RepID=A0A8H9GC51_9MICO|nr:MULTISPECIES: hypothetical protein [Curtobacterium]MBM7802655.1 hypothetical protein [Curtobacterium luteum]NUU49660.1 hypothetical protein [Curtobacterium luteum]GGL10381.1 hypothetical protein GCM10009769_30570 [Curtobacterium luteum]
MLFGLAPRAFSLALGVGALVAGVIMALLGLVVGPDSVGLVAAGFVIAAMGLLAAAVGAIGFALHGSVRSERGATKRQPDRTPATAEARADSDHTG